YRLKDRYGIDPSNVDTWKLKVDFGLDEKIVEEYENMRDGNGIIKLTLSLDFKLLKDLKDEIGDLKEDKELLDLLSKRNSSILAHGLEPIDEKTAKRFYEKVLEIARRSIKDFNKKIEWSEFPKL
ncbi:MAG TPA: hypothetical protein ENI51_06210, partial [Candidatus Atribacteria bacterium]|nr:hypothetical protein [Candidatus Atribacteria bacterium]